MAKTMPQVNREQVMRTVHYRGWDIRIGLAPDFCFIATNGKEQVGRVGLEPILDAIDDVEYVKKAKAHDPGILIKKDKPYEYQAKPYEYKPFTRIEITHPNKTFKTVQERIEEWDTATYPERITESSEPVTLTEIANILIEIRDLLKLHGSYTLQDIKKLIRASVEEGFNRKAGG
jgi:hypothetical protein